MLVTLETAKAHLRDPEGEDALIQLYIGAAEQSVLEFINRKVYATQAELDAAVANGTAGESPMVINDALRAATLLILSDLFANREETITGTIVATLPTGSRHLMQPYRVGMGV